MRIDLAFMFLSIGIAIGTWANIGVTRYLEWKAKVDGWKQRAEWYDEDKRKREG